MKKTTHTKIIKGMVIFLIPVFIFHGGYLIYRIINNTFCWDSLIMMSLVGCIVINSTFDAVGKKRLSKPIRMFFVILNISVLIFATIFLISVFLK